MLVAAAMASVASTAVGVSESEYQLGLYRKQVPRGTVRFNLTNRGMDPHDLAIRDASGRELARLSAPVLPGERATLTVTLPRTGVYQLYCTLGNHEQLGMRGRVRVIKAKRR